MSTKTPRALWAFLIVALLAASGLPLEAVTAEGVVYRYFAEEHKTLEDLLGEPGSPVVSPPDFVSTIALFCPKIPLRQSPSEPFTNIFPVDVNGATVEIELRDDIFSQPVVLACFYDGAGLSSPAGCFGQGTCTWHGGRADHVELWVPIATMFEGSIVKGSKGDVTISIS